MTCPNYGAWPAFAGIALIALTIAAGYLAGRHYRRKRARAMRTADARAIERQTREIQQLAPARNLVQLADVNRRAVIVRHAKAAAAVDFRDTGRRRANPYPTHSRDAAAWAVEYAAAWQELVDATGPDPLGPNPHRSGHGPDLVA